MRKNVGVVVLVLSVLYSAIDLLGWLRPSLIRMRAHGGWERTVAVVAGSLFLKGIVLLGGGLLAFWPDRSSFDAR